jgi:hypothetical protein
MEFPSRDCNLTNCGAALRRSLNRYEMRFASFRSHRHLRLLWTRPVRRMRQTECHATHGLFGELRCRPDPRRPRDGIHFTKKPAKCPRQRILFVSLRRAFRCGCNWRALLSACAVFNLVCRRLQLGFYCVGGLVQLDCAETKCRTIRLPAVFHSLNFRVA